MPEHLFMAGIWLAYLQAAGIMPHSWSMVEYHDSNTVSPCIYALLEVKRQFRLTSLSSRSCVMKCCTIYKFPSVKQSFWSSRGLMPRAIEDMGRSAA